MWQTTKLSVRDGPLNKTQSVWLKFENSLEVELILIEPTRPFVAKLRNSVTKMKEIFKKLAASLKYFFMHNHPTTT